MVHSSRGLLLAMTACLKRRGSPSDKEFTLKGFTLKGI
jgi:hypothetical protein